MKSGSGQVLSRQGLAQTQFGRLCLKEDAGAVVESGMLSVASAPKLALGFCLVCVTVVCRVS